MYSIIQQKLVSLFFSYNNWLYKFKNISNVLKTRQKLLMSHNFIKGKKKKKSILQSGTGKLNCNLYVWIKILFEIFVII